MDPTCRIPKQEPFPGKKDTIQEIEGNPLLDTVHKIHYMYIKEGQQRQKKFYFLFLKFLLLLWEPVHLFSSQQQEVR